MKSLHDLLNQPPRPTKPGAPHREIGALLQSDRGFPNGFWHAQDADGALDVMIISLGNLGLDSTMLPEPFVRAVVERHAGSLCTDEDEDLARRREIADAVLHVNSLLKKKHSPYRFFSFAEDMPGWESNEPVWMLLTEDERTTMIERNLVRKLD